MSFFTRLAHFCGNIAGFLLMLVCFPASAMEPIEGFEDLKFGMTPAQVQSLPDCSSSSECLYEIAGQNRYISLFYRPHSQLDPIDAPSAGQNHDSRLTRIDINMGRYLENWYANLYMRLNKSYPLTHDLTAQDDRRFGTGESNELAVGFAEGRVVLKIFRRPFGNMIIRVVYQNEEEATAWRAMKEAP